MGEKRTSVARRLKKFIIQKTEKFFYWYGESIALQPWRWIAGCLLLVAICSIGLFRFRQEKNPMRLWIPQDSDFKRDTDWIIDQFKEGYRMQYLLVTAPNVLEPYVLLEVEKVRKRIVKRSYQNVTWEDVCFRIPAFRKNQMGLTNLLGRRKRSFFFLPKTDGNIDIPWYIQALPYDRYCQIVNGLPKECLETNLQQLWYNDEYTMDRLTLDDVIEQLNKTTISPIYNHPTNFPQLLGGAEKDEKGRIVSAKSLLSVWLVRVNFSDVDMDKTGNQGGTGDWVTGPTLAWEEGFLNVMENAAKEYAGTNLTMYYEAGRSYGDISSAAMFQDIEKLFLGSFLMFCFVQFVLPSRFNLVEMRFWLGSMGLFCIILAFVTGVAICSLLGVPYSPVHTSLPFLLLGIGVDDMFVIISCWKNLSPSERKLPLEKQIASTLSHAGISITVTSITDIVAFLVGSLTILPSLQSFCIYTAVGLFIMYVFQATLFVAFLALDERRIQRGANSLIWCYQHVNFKHKEIPAETRQAKVFGSIYGKFLFTKPVKVFVLLVTVGLAGFGIKGNLELKQKFDPKWFLPDHSYLLQFFNQRNHFYPDFGKDGAVYVGQAKYSEQIGNIYQLTLTLEEQTDILKEVDSWVPMFIRHTEKYEYVNVLQDNVTEDEFSTHLSRFLWSTNGARFQKNFRFNGNFVCGKPAPPITMSSIDFIFKNFKGSSEHLPAMNRLKDLVRESNITAQRVTAWAKIFSHWITDEVIDRELYRNLAMALSCVMICTGLLIIDLQICFWIFTCVLLTLVDVAGFMYFWGLYIDITSCIALVLAVGLCVDFAAHVGHIFLALTGTREERALNTVKYIGTAACNGAFSTVLALSVLGTSDAYTFQTFFKIFMLVIIFGLFHGIVFLPVILSMIGPPSFNDGKGASRTPHCEVICDRVVDGSEDVAASKKLDVNFSNVIT